MSNARSIVSLGAVVTMLPIIGYLGHAADASPRWQATMSSSSDSTAIHAFWSTLDRTWAARDADRFSQYFTEDASFAFLDRGRWLETRATIHQYFTEQFRSQRPDLRHATKVDAIRPIAEQVVAVDGEVEILEDGARDATPTVLRRLAITAVMVRDAGAWRIHLLRAYPSPATPP